MKKAVIIAWLMGIFLQGSILSAQDGKALFEKNCARCHSIGEGKLIGPDLANVDKRRDMDWLIKFIQSSQSMIEQGDSTAKALYKEFNETKMPDQDLSKAEVKAVVSYIGKESPPYNPDEGKQTAKADQKQEEQKPEREVTEEAIEKGRMLFIGQKRLENGGPSCISCHNVKNDQTPGGGLLAKELTKSAENMGLQGVKSMAKNPGFPAMQEAYDDNPVTDDEAFYLAAFLKHVSEERYYQHSDKMSKTFLWSGIGGVVVLFGVFSLLWWSRKEKSVNHRIYKRQKASYSKDL